MYDGSDQRDRAGGITTQPRGVCRRVLKPRDAWEGPSGKAATANRTRGIRTSGMRGGLTETWTKVARAVFLPGEDPQG